MRGTSLSDDKLADDLGNAIEVHESAVVGRIFLQQENQRRAIWDFCNKIGTQRRNFIRPYVRSWGKLT